MFQPAASLVDPTMTAVGKFLERLATGLALIGGLGLLFAVVLTCLSIVLKILRRSLDWALGGVFDVVPWAFIRPILGEEELVQYAVGLALFAALPWVTLRRGHVRIDIFERRFGGVFNRLLDVLADACLVLFAYLILTRHWSFVVEKRRRSDPATLWENWVAGNWDALWARVNTQAEFQVLGIQKLPLFIVAEGCIFVLLIVALFTLAQSVQRVWAP